jgi:hypothetical protein
MRRRWSNDSLLAVSVFAAIAAACGTKGALFGSGSGDGSGAGGTAGGSEGAGGQGSVSLGGIGPDSAQCASLVVSPAALEVTVNFGSAGTTTNFSVTAAGQPIAASFELDRGEIGSITPQGAFRPRGETGGTATVTATVRGGCTATTSVRVRIVRTQNGAAPGDNPEGAPGAGGFNGVGGEGVGTTVSDPAVLSALTATPTTDESATWLYPYAGTVFPRGMLAPLLQWRRSSPVEAQASALRLRITENSFTFEGFFGRPAALDGADDFVRHPIPQSVWEQAVRSNEGEPLRVELTYVAGSRTVALPPLDLAIARSPVKGTVYYQSYGTNLARNLGGAIYYDSNGVLQTRKFGGAVLAIKPGATAPTAIAGEDGDSSKCFVCHAASSNGSRIVTGRQSAGGSPRRTSSVSLFPGGGTLDNPTLPDTTGDSEGIYNWPAIFTDGSYLLSNATSEIDGSSNLPSALYSIPDGAPLTSTGLPPGLRMATPVFSHDGKHVAFNFYGGTVSLPGGDVTGDKRSIAVMDYDAATRTFSNFRVVFTPDSALTLSASPASERQAYAVWPTFLPDGKHLIFQLTRLEYRNWALTRSACEDAPSTNGWPNACHDRGNRAELWIVNIETKVARALNRLNGLDAAGNRYIPEGPASHDMDDVLAYEPTVNPVVSGGYAWVVFMSRRLYGNVATVNPWWSDPRFRDISPESKRPTTKKLWVAAIDLNAPDGTDPSHPAFYLPAQELYAGNTRGYWVLDPCKADGNGCQSGDECCGGFCRPNAENVLVCSAEQPNCAQEFERCASKDDCCDPTQNCINNVCSNVVR